MLRQYIAVASVTQAIKGKELLHKNGIYADVVKTSKSVSKKGCGYSIVVYKRIDEAKEILEENQIEILGVTGEEKK